MLADRTAASAGLSPPHACKQPSWELHLVSRTPAGIGLWLDVRGTLKKSPKLSKLTREVCQWLNTLDPKQVAACGPGEWPRTEIPVGAAYGDWVLELRAAPHHVTGLIQKWPGRRRSGTIGKELRRAIRKKAAQHRGIDAPLVVAVNDAGASGRTFEVAALYGPQKIAFPTGDDLPRSGPGIWLYGNPANATNTSISGVLLFRGAFALYAPEAVQACLYLNSYVEDVVPEELRVFGYADAPDGELRFHEGRSVGEGLGISQGLRTQTCRQRQVGATAAAGMIARVGATAPSRSTREAHVPA